MLTVHKINGNDYVSMLELYSGLGLASAAYKRWVEMNLLKYFTENEDFINSQHHVENYKLLTHSDLSRKHKKHKNAQDYLLNITCAKEIAMMARTDKSKEYRKWLISLEDKVMSGELMTVEESILAHKLIRAFEYLENQKQARELHQKTYIDNLVKNELIKTSPYVLFEKYRRELLGYDKEMIGVWLDKYCEENFEYPRNLKKRAEMEKMPQYKQTAIANASQAIKTAITDYLYGAEVEDDKQRIILIVGNLVKTMEGIKVKTNAPMFNEIPDALKSTDHKQII